MNFFRRLLKKHAHMFHTHMFMTQKTFLSVEEVSLQISGIIKEEKGTATIMSILQFLSFIFSAICALVLFWLHLRLHDLIWKTQIAFIVDGITICNCNNLDPECCHMTDVEGFFLFLSTCTCSPVSTSTCCAHCVVMCPHTVHASLP